MITQNYLSKNHIVAGVLVDIAPKNEDTFTVCSRRYIPEGEGHIREGVDFDFGNLIDAVFWAGELLGEYGSFSDKGVMIEISIYDADKLVYRWSDD